jgi:hypothetical protein
VGVRSRAGLLAATAVLLAACGTPAVEPTTAPTPDPAVVPSRSPQVINGTADGPAVELGSAVTGGLGWRYVAYLRNERVCTQLETAAAVESACGVAAPDEGEAFGSVRRNERLVHGIATAEAATVWLVVNNTPAVPAVLMPLTEVGLDGALAFVAVLPTGVEASHVMAVRMNGEVLGTLELP